MSARAAGGGEHRVQDGPVGYGVRAVLHGFCLAVGGGDAAGVEVVAAYDDRGAYGAVGGELVEAEAGAVAFARAEPADAGGEALEVDLLAGLPDPARETLVFGEELQHRLVGRRYVGRIPREGGPPEGALALAEERPDVRGHEAGVAVRPLVAAELRLAAQAVAVVEDLCAAVHETDHRRAVTGHRAAGLPQVAPGGAPPPRRRGFGGVAGGDVTDEGVVGRGLVRDDLRGEAAFEKGGKDLGGVAEDADGDGLAAALRLFGPFYRGV